MKEYIRTKSERYVDGFSEANDCSVVAVAIACNVPYSHAHEAVKECGRENRHSCNHKKWSKAIELLGGNIKEKVFCVRGYRDVKRLHNSLEGWLVQENKKTATVGNIEKTLDPNKRYILKVKGHALAMVNGRVEDFTRGSRRPVILYYEIEGA